MIDKDLIALLDKKSISDKVLKEKIIPGLGLSDKRDFGGGRSNQQTLTIVDVLDYYREINVYGSEKQMRTRLLLVGAGFSGKTTLIHHLVNKGEFKEKSDRTDGVKMHEFVLKCDLIKKDDKRGNEVTFNILDFAGQKEYTHTHQLFFEKDSLFLVVYRHRPESDKQGKETDEGLDELNELKDFVSKINNCIETNEGSDINSDSTNTDSTATSKPQSNL